MKKNNGTTETPASVICDGEQQVGACPVVSPLRQVTNPVGSTYTADSTKTIAEEMESIAPTCENDWMDQLIDWATRLRALPPTELGGVEGPLRVFSEGVWVYEETGQRFSARDLDEAAFAEYLRHPLPTPRAAEAISLVDIGLCNWAAHILSDPERFNTRANDASAAIRRLVAALTPPSAKGE